MQDTTVPLCLDRRAAAALAGMSVSWLRRMDATGDGPPKLRLGRGPGRIRYPVGSYIHWLQAHTDAIVR
jgi:predicted DNA-binding transcriptional regulator AlpA